MEQLEIDSPKKLKETVKEVLSDEYRSGKPLKFTPEQAAFLTDKSHDIRIVDTPKHSSWLNQIECWFSIITRRFLNKRATFKSVEELEKGIQRFIAFYNDHMAKPFNMLALPLIA